MSTYYYPSTYPRIHTDRISDYQEVWEDRHPFNDFLVDGDAAFDLLTGCPSLAIVIAYKVAGTLDPTPPAWLDYVYSGGPPVGTGGGYTPPTLVPPGGTPEDFYDAYRYLVGLRFIWHVGLLRAESLVATAFHDGTHHMETEAPEGDTTRNKAMAYGNVGKKNAGAWFRMNEIVRHNPDLKTKLNADTFIRAAMVVMLTHVKDIAAANGYTLETGENITTKSQNAFPITKQFWMGYLPFSTFIPPGSPDAGDDQHREDFAASAAVIRKRATGLVKSYKLVTDAFNEAVEANPGGVV